MYIKELKIHNYRNFRDLTIELKPITLIIGENNIGKSNLLDAIGLIFSQDVSFFKRRVLEVADFHHQTIKEFKEQILNDAIASENITFPEIRISVRLTDWNPDQEAVIADWYTDDADLSEAELTYVFAPIGSLNKIDEINEQRAFIDKVKTDMGAEDFEAILPSEKLDLINFPISKYHYTIFGGNQRESQINTYHLNQLKFELLDALRDAKTELVASHNNRLLFRILNSKEENEYQDLKTELIGLQKAINDNTALQSIKASITTQLEKISLANDSSSNLVDLIFSIPNVEDILKKLSLIYGDNPIRIERNGTGRNNLLFISLMLSFIEDTTRGQSTYFRVVGLEEPESHLHPNLQDHLAANIENLIKMPGGAEYRKDIQLLLTSHSTHITTKIDFQNTVVLYHHDNSIKPHYILSGFDTSTTAGKYMKYLNKYFDAINTNIFYSRRIVLVEGISEKLLFPVFFSLHTGQSIEKLSCCVVNVNGLAFKNFLEIIKNGYFQKCFVITDSDTGTRVENRADTLAQEYQSVSQIKVGISAQSTFEKDVISANKSGDSRRVLLEVVKLVRPTSGTAYVTTLGENDIDIEPFFELIEKHKSDFAYYLSMKLEENPADFVVPPYITEGIDFIINQ